MKLTKKKRSNRKLIKSTTNIKSMLSTVIVLRKIHINTITMIIITTRSIMTKQDMIQTKRILMIYSGKLLMLARIILILTQLQRIKLLRKATST